MSIKPITPKEVAEQLTKNIPEFIIEAVNELIAKKIVDGRAVVPQDEIIELLEFRNYDRETIYRNKWLDIEPLYEHYGWTVKYNRPAYNENWNPYFVFTAK